MNDLERLLKRIRAYMREHDMTASDFGVKVCNSSALVHRLRKGNVRYDTIKNVNAWLDEQARAS